MKIIKKICLLFFLSIIAVICDAQTITGTWQSSIEEDNRTDHQTTFFYANSADYAQGGITFFYPYEYFSSAPQVHVTVELNGLQYSNDLQISPVVVKNTPSSVTVYVNKETVGLFSKSTTEVAGNDVIIHLFAFGS